MDFWKVLLNGELRLYLNSIISQPFKQRSATSVRENPLNVIRSTLRKHFETELSHHQPICQNYILTLRLSKHRLKNTSPAKC